jgi:hypothetical protein
VVDYSGCIQRKRIYNLHGSYMLEERIYKDELIVISIKPEAGYDMIFKIKWLQKYYAIISVTDRTIVLQVH